MEKEKVSLITPCYNGERFIGRYLESVLNQSYSNIELILINDGSTDHTEKIIKSYEEKLCRKGITFIYKYQENAGQAEAINKGLEIFTGTYVSWPDSDDILEKDYVKNKVLFLEKNQDVDMVITNVASVSEENIEKINSIFKRIKPEGKETFFKDLITEENVSFQPGAYMVRSSALLKYVGRNIYGSRGGQNWQMLLPIAYFGKIGYLDQTLYRYVNRKDSHSKEVYGDYEKKRKRNKEHEDILFHVLQFIHFKKDGEREFYLSMVDEKYARRNLEMAFWYSQKEHMEKEYRRLSELGCVTKEDKKYDQARHNILKWHCLKSKVFLQKVKNKIFS